MSNAVHLLKNSLLCRPEMSAEGFKEQDPTFATRAIHDAQDPEQWDAMPVVLPISLATTFKQDAPAEFRVTLIPVYIPYHVL